MAEGFRIDAAWLDALDQYVEGLQQDAVDAAVEAVEFAEDAVISYARQKPDWVNLADGIQTWSEDGRLVIGVQGNERVSQAVALEYGDLENPPDSLFRTLDAVGHETRTVFRNRFAARRPVYIPGVKL